MQAGAYAQPVPAPSPDIGHHGPMKAKDLRILCMSLTGATEQIQWGDDRVFKIGGKMFACSGTAKDSRYSFKVDDEHFLELTDFAGIDPAPYLARAHWIQIDPAECELSKPDLEMLVRRSYELVLSKLPGKTRKAILDTDQ